MRHHTQIKPFRKVGSRQGKRSTPPDRWTPHRPRGSGSGALSSDTCGRPPAPLGSWSFLDSPHYSARGGGGGGGCTQLLLRPSLSLQGTDLLLDREGVGLRAWQGRLGRNEGLVSDEQSGLTLQPQPPRTLVRPAERPPSPLALAFGSSPPGLIGSRSQARCGRLQTEPRRR